MDTQRIRIAIEVKTQGAKAEKELPFKLLVAACFNPATSENPFSHFQGIRTIDTLLKKMKPCCSINIPNTMQPKAPPFYVDIKPLSRNDFTPDKLIMQIPVLCELQGLRNLLLDLRNRWLLDKNLRSHCQQFLNAQDEKTATVQEHDNP